MLSADLRRKLGHTFLVRGAQPESLYLDNFYAAFSGEEIAALGVAGQRPLLWDTIRPPLERMLYADQKTYLVELLMKQDQMSMATSIESRVPFLDHPLVEFSTRVPSNLKLRGKTGKYILRKAAEDLLPRDIIYRAKMGFPTPLRHWLREPRAETLFARILAPDGLAASCLDRRKVQSLIARHRAGREDATDRIWRLLNLELWSDLFLNGKRRGEGLLASTPAPASV